MAHDTQFVETNALLAALEENDAKLDEVIDGMTLHELTTLRTALGTVDRAALRRTGELQRAQWGTDRG